MSRPAIWTRKTSHEIMQTLTSLNREQGVTIIVVTHEADIATYADRVLTMRDGQIISDERKQKGAKAPRPPIAAAATAGEAVPAPAAPFIAGLFGALHGPSPGW